MIAAIINAYQHVRIWEKEIADSFFGAETMLTTIKTGTVYLLMNIIIASQIQEWAKAVAAIIGVLVIAVKLGIETYKWLNRKELYGNKSKENKEQ